MMDAEHVAALVAEQDALRAEVERLRGLIKASQAFGAKAASNAAGFKSERDALRARIERLEAALREEAARLGIAPQDLAWIERGDEPEQTPNALQAPESALQGSDDAP